MSKMRFENYLQILNISPNPHFSLIWKMRTGTYCKQFESSISCMFGFIGETWLIKVQHFASFISYLAIWVIVPLLKPYDSIVISFWLRWLEQTILNKNSQLFYEENDIPVHISWIYMWSRIWNRDLDFTLDMLLIY